MASKSPERATLRTHADRDAGDRAAEFLAAGQVAHVGFIVEGQPFVIPFTYHFESETPDRLYLHGSQGSRAVRHLASGAPVCITVTALDGLVYSRTALYHSMNYRSVVVFGTARKLEGTAEKRRVFERMTARYFPGRTAGRDYDVAPDTDLDATAMLEVAIEEMSSKMRAGGPAGPRDQDPDAPGTCGVIDLDGRA